MLKRLLFSSLVLVAMMLVFVQNNVAEASSKEYDCSITIDANKHHWGNHALPTKGCTSSEFSGYWDGERAQLMGTYSGYVSDGQIVDLAGIDKVKVTVIPPKVEPKPEPKPQPKPDPKPKPKPKPEPKPEPKPKPKPTPQPKEKLKNNTSNTSNKSNSKKSESTTKAKGNSKSGSSEGKSGSTSKKTSSSTSQKADKSTNKLTLKELKNKNADVKERDGEFVAVIKDKDGKVIEQKISKKDAEKLLDKDGKAKKEEGELKLDDKSNNEAVAKGSIEKDEEKKEKKSGFGIVMTIVMIAALGIGGGYFFYKKRNA